MPGKQIHRALLTADPEGNFDRALPPEAGQSADQRFADRGMHGIQETIELLPSPSYSDVQLAAERNYQCLDTTYRHTGEIAALHARHGRLRHPATPGQIHLAQAEPMPQRPNRSAELLKVHGAEISRGRLSGDCAAEQHHAGA